MYLNWFDHVRDDIQFLSQHNIFNSYYCIKKSPEDHPWLNH